MLHSIDENSTGLVKFSIFQQLLEINKIILSQKNLEKIRLEHRAISKIGSGDHTDMIKYKEALKSIHPNLELNEPLMKEWVLTN